MIWLLPYVAYALAAGAAGYAAVSRFQVVQRVLAGSIERALRKVAENLENGKHAYTLERTDAGVVVSSLVIARAALRAAHGGGTQVTGVQVDRMELDFPSLSRPLSVRIVGVRVWLQQQKLPEPRSPEGLLADERRQRREDKAQRLALIEDLLWGAAKASRAGYRRWNPAGAYLGRLQAKAMQKAVAFVAQFVSVQLSDARVQYMQYGEPGPRPAVNHLQGADAAVVHLRHLSLEPQGDTAVYARPSTAAPSADSDPAPAPSPPQSPHSGGAPPEEPTWWQALASLPHLFYSHVITNVPSATKLTVSGVSLSLLTFPSTWQGCSEARRAEAPAPAFFTFTPGHPTAPEQRAAGSKRRRAAVTAQRVDAPAGASGSSSNSSAQTPGQATNAQPATSISAQPQPAQQGAWVDFDQLLHGVPAEEHVLFRQWELSVVLCLLPPGHEHIGPLSASPAAVQAQVVPPPQPSSPPADDPATTPVPEPSRAYLAANSMTDTGRPFGSLQEGATPDFAELEHALSGGIEPGATLDFGSYLSHDSMQPGSDAGTPVTSPLASQQHAGTIPRRENVHSAAATAVADATGVEAASHEASTSAKSSLAAPPPNSTASHDKPEQAGSSGSSRGCTVEVSAFLKALVPEVNATSVAILHRLVERQLHVARFGPHWSTRPQVPVSGHEAVWWQHAGRTLATECRHVARRQVPLSRLAHRRALRLEYQGLYASCHVSSPGFKEPGLRWWNRRRVGKADDGALKRLKALEDSLTLEELAHFRCGVATTYNSNLVSQQALTRFIIDKVDALVFTKGGGMAKGLAELLLHRDRAPAGAASQLPSDASLFALRVSVTCPKLGVAFDMRPSAGHGSPEEEPYVSLALHSVGASLDADSSITLQVDGLQCGACSSPTSAVSTLLLSSPSTLCQRVCKAADFFRYAVTGSVLSESAHSKADFCAQMTIKPRYGLGGVAVDDVQLAAPAAAEGAAEPAADIQDWRPAGFEVSIQLAVVGITYDRGVASALLSFAEACDECKSAPWAWTAPSRPSHPTAPPQAEQRQPPQAAAWPPPLPQHAESASSMVLRSFAARQVPVLGHMALPLANLSVHCPGVAIQLPYAHKLRPDVFRSGPGGRRPPRRLQRDEGSDDEVSSAALPTDHASRGPSPEPVTSAAAAGIAGVAGKPPPSRLRVPTSALHMSYVGDEAPETEGKEGEEADGVWEAGEEEESPSVLYNFTVAVQNIQVHVFGEDQGGWFQGGSARRIQAAAFVDVFSYLSRTSRRTVARHIMPGRVTFDPGRRQFTEEVAGIDALEAELREVEITSMAKVWAYPEDMPSIIRSIREREVAEGDEGDSVRVLLSAAMAGRGPPQRSPSGGLTPGMSAASGLAATMPQLMRDPSQYPMPLVPYLKAGALQTNVVQRLSAAPDEPGGAASAAAAHLQGVQAWFSPIHVWHLVSLQAAVQRVVDYLRDSVLASNRAAERQAAAAERRADVVQTPRPNRRVVLSLEVEKISLLWLIGTWTSKGPMGASVGGGSSSSGRYSRNWGVTVKRDDPAYLWAQWLAPVYSSSLARINIAVCKQHTGAVLAGASIDGIILRDLQLPDYAKHAYVLRPLPARARRLNRWLHGMRRTLLGIKSTSLGQLLWWRAFRKVQLRWRTSAVHLHALLKPPVQGGDLLGSLTRSPKLLGPQIVVRFSNGRMGFPGGPPVLPGAEVTAEVGQMLAYVRIKQQASMTAFATQLTQILKVITGESQDHPHQASPHSAPNAAPAAAAAAAAAGSSAKESRRSGPRLQSPLRINVLVVGIDVLFRVESRDLMSLKLQQGRVTVDRKAVTRNSAPGDIRLHLSATVQDVVVQDMRASPEHALVLIPNRGAEYCSFDSIYTVQVDPRRHAPCLILDLQNPRVLLLLRFVSDIMQAVDILGAAVGNAAGSATGAASAVGTAAAAAGGGGDTSVPPNDAAGPAAARAETAAAPKASNKPLEIVMQLRNVGLIVPTSASARSVLAGQVEHFMLAMPGNALPTSLLDDSDLPSVEGMIEESLLSNMTYKFSGFHDQPANAPQDGAAAGAPAAGEKPTTEAGRAAAPAAPPVAAEPTEAAVTAAAVLSSKTKLQQGKEEELPLEDGEGGSLHAIKRRGGMSRRRNREAESGVLYLDGDEDYGARPSGVLHVQLPDLDEPATMTRPGSRPQTTAEFQDNVLAGPAAVAKQAVRATKALVGGIRDALEGHELERSGELAADQPGNVVIDHRQRPASKESVHSTVGPSARAARAAPAAAVPAVSLAQDSHAAGVGAQPAAEKTVASMALCIEKFEVVTGSLVRVPNFYHTAAGDRDKPNPRQGSFIPPSLSSFSWPSQVYDVAPHGPLLRACNISTVLFGRYAASKRTTQFHISATPLSAVLSAPNYTAIMDFVHGNLNDLLHPPGKGPKPPGMPPQVRFNPALKFGPRPGASASFRLTVAVPRVAVVLAAHPREWTSASPCYEWVGSLDSHLLRPFFHASVSNLLLDLGTMPPGDTFINICATSLDVQDLRIGYRLHEVSDQVPPDVELDDDGSPELLDTPGSLWRQYGSAEEHVEVALPAVHDEEAASHGSSTPSDYGTPGSHSPRSSVDGAASTPRTPLDEDSPFAFPTDPELPQLTPGLFRSGSGAFGGARHAAAAGAEGVSPSGSYVQHGQAPPTGIRLSVARRLSEHSHRQRAASVEALSPGTRGAPTPGRAAAGGATRHYLPVIDFSEMPELDGAPGEEVAAVRVITAPHNAPLEERLPKSASTRLPGSNPNVRVEVSVALLADSTTAVEVAVSHALLQWPYFQDLSLIWSIANVFKSPSAEYREELAGAMPPTAAPAAGPPATGASSWLYVNAILTDTEFFLPVVDAEVAEHMAGQLWGARAESPGTKSYFRRVADIALASMLLDSTDTAGALALEERGMALAATALRVNYAAGGDGESVIRVDLREFAAFVRDPGARVNCVLQPLSGRAQIDMRVPEAAEHMEAQRLNLAAAAIQRHWRAYRARREMRSAMGASAGAATVGSHAMAALTATASQRRIARSSLSGADDTATDRGRQWRLVDELVMDVASPHTRSLLESYRRSSQDRTTLMYLSQYRAMASTVVRVDVGPVTVRAAFSHIPFWQAAVDGVQRVMLQPSAAPASTAAKGLGRSNSPSGGSSSGLRAQPFRPASLQVTGALQTAALVLCNDKPETFGAPDVLQYSLCGASVAYDAATLLPDRPANKAGRLSVSTYASFLNSGTSRWEPLYELWPVQVEFVDINSAMYLSDRKTNLWVTSERHLNATFNPASLMSFGDALAFLRSFQDRSNDAAAATARLLPDSASERQLLHLSEPSPGLRPRVAAPAAAAAAGVASPSGAFSVTSRAPQKYLVQNQSGMRVFYWADMPPTSIVSRTPVYTLDNGASDTLRVAPASKRLSFVHFTSTAASAERAGAVINLHFEGNWMPIRDVAVSVVGKYRYTMLSPADNTTVPVLVDIILVGRTKIITLHSSIWVENAIDRPVSLRLHIPTTPLVPPPAGLAANSSGASVSVARTDGDVRIGPLLPKGGCYLPLTAALGGLLFLQPEGYAEASRDVMRLSADVDVMMDQQGYISCESLLPAGAPLHVAMEAAPARLLSDFQAFKHVECLAPGTLQRATSPLEVTISIQPTMVVTNALPYEMRVLLWQMAPPEAQTASAAAGEGPQKSAPLPPVTPGTAQHVSLLEMLSPRTSVAVAVPRRGSPGRYYSYSIPPGEEQDVYVDMRQNVLVHVSVEEINMRSVKWSLCSWAQRAQRSGDSRETQFTTRLPKDIQLRMVGVGMPLPISDALITRYLLNLKDVTAHLRTVHKQFNKDARTAISHADIEAAVMRVRAFARRMGKVSTKVVKNVAHIKPSAPRGARRPPAGPTTRLVPPRPQPPPVSPPSAAQPAVAAPPRAGPGVAEGGVLKRKGLLWQRWNRVKLAEGTPSGTAASWTAEAAAAPGTAAGAPPTAASPPQSILRTATAPQPEQPAPEVELTQSSRPGRSAWRRPAPLEINEEPLPASALPPTPFDQWAAGEEEEQEEEEEEEVQARAPPVLHLGVYNSLAERGVAHAGVCRITLHVPFWLNNRTGVDLFYKDRASAPPQPLLLGAPLPFDYGEVFAPGTSLTELPEKEGSEAGSGAPWGRGTSIAGGSSVNVSALGLAQAVLEYKLVLMNTQDEVQLGLAHVRKRRYSSPVGIKTAGNKGSVELRGPPMVQQPVHQRVLEGLRHAALKGTAGVEHLRARGADPAESTDEEGQVLAPEPGSRNDLMTVHREQAEEPLRLARHSVDLLSKEAGTMLVRLTSSGRTPVTTRRLPNVRRSLEGAGPSTSLAAGLTPGLSGALPDEDAAAALEEMLKVPVPPQNTGLTEALQELSSREQLAIVKPTAELATAEDLAAAAAATEQQQQAAVAEEDSQESVLATGPSFSPHTRFLAPVEGQSAQELADITVAQAQATRRIITMGQRLFEFAVDVAAGPPDSIYRHTKLVTLKPKYIIENQTGLPVEVKQLNTPDPQEDGQIPVSRGFARLLLPGQRAAVYWDDSELPRELVVRPRPATEVPDAWHWSGGFPIPDTEWYFGLRIRHRRGSRRYMNIPVNVTVGASGSVQVTLKNPASVPPYRIENTCKDVLLYFVQVPLVFRQQGKMYVDSLQPGESMPYAWDEPTMLTKLRVQAKVTGRTTESRVADYTLDHLGDVPMLLLPTHGEMATGGAARRLYRTLSTDLPEEVKRKLVSLLAAEFSKKVYVSVYADGPTRVLRFSDEKNISSLEQQHVMLDLAARLKQVEGQLRAVNAQFVRLSGVSGAHAFALDLYGRMPVQKEPQAASAAGQLTRRPSRKVPLPQSTQALVHRVSRHVSTRQPGGASLPESPSSSSLAALAGPAPIPSGGLKAGSRQSSLLRATSPTRAGRQSVRFDSRNLEATGGSSLNGRDSMEASSPVPPQPGVLSVEDAGGTEGEGRADTEWPYNHLTMHTGSEALPTIPSTSEAAEGASSPDARPASPEIQAAPAEGADESSADTGEVGAPDQTRRRPARRSESRDWGHIDALREEDTGTRAMGATAAGMTAAAKNNKPSGARLVTAATLQRRQDLLRVMADSDAVLLIGGDLNVTVVQAKGLAGLGRSTHPFARVRIRDPIPVAAEEMRAKQTSVVWQSTDPVWDEQLLFRDVCAASELVVELWDLGGTRSSAQLKNLSANPAEVIKSCRFLGRIEVPLGETLDVPAGTPLWFPVMRRSAADSVSGQLQLRFLWDVTARGLLTIKLAALERVLAQRREIMAALQPIPARTSLDWTAVAPEVVPSTPKAPPAAAAHGAPDAAADADGNHQRSPTKAAASAAAGFNLFGVDSELGPAGPAPVVRPSRVAAEVLTRHSHDHNRRHLVVTVLEARGLNPRRGVVVALSANELPNPVVTVSLPGYPAYTTPVLPHTLNPRWAADRRHVFHVADQAHAALTIRLSDQRGGLRRTTVALGEGVIHASHIRGENPSYVWVSLAPPGKRGRVAAPPGEGEVAELQVFVRLQWQTEVVRGSSIKVEVDAAGAGLMVVGGLQDELFNVTVDSVRVMAVRTRLELILDGSIHKVQLDNQMLNAVEPVVLAPDTSARTADKGAMITFGFTRSFAGSDSTSSAASGLIAAGHFGASCPDVSEAGAGGSTGDLSALGASGVDADGAAGAITPAADQRGIRSFKDFHLSIAQLDLMTDEAFLEALLSFFTSLPTADVRQDRLWQEQQRRLLAAQFGPREVESLAINAVVAPPAGQSSSGRLGSSSAAASALGWVLEKEARDLEALHGQSDLSSWFFIESAQVGVVAVNVTVSLSSRFITANHGLAGNGQAGSGSFNRTLGASGFQLVNVSNVPITLGRWMVGNDPNMRGRFSNGFLSQRALAANLRRHYTREALKESHKVLGGAGPAVASVPLTVLWASGSAFALVKDLSSGQTGPLAAVQQTLYVPIMSFSMFVSGFSRMLAAGMAFVPPHRESGDDETVRRIIVRPQNALEALTGAPREVGWGINNAARGIILDPVAGWHEYHIPGFALGLGKALVGLPVRPIIGLLEFGSKGTAALALSALGREGIVGKMQRRVRAPGAFADDSTEAMEDGPRSEAQAQARALQAAWQRVLPEFFPQMAGDTVTDVINARSTRVVLITDRHVAYLRARHLPQHSIYKAKWLVPIAEVQNIRGDSGSRKITIAHVHRYNLKLLGVWPVQKRKGLRCGSRALYERTVLRLTKVQHEVQGGGGEEGAGGEQFVGANMTELTILSAPYHPPTPHAAATSAQPLQKEQPGAAGSSGAAAR